MRKGLAGLFMAAAALTSTSASAIPITIGFLAEVGRVNSAPFDFNPGPIRGSWTYDSETIGESMDGGGTRYVSEGPGYGLTIHADGIPSFHYEDVAISVYNDVSMTFTATEILCRGGDRIADVYRVGSITGISPWSFMFLNCSADVLDSEAIPLLTLGSDEQSFRHGRAEASMLLDFRGIGGPQTFILISEVFLVPEPSIFLLLLLAGAGLLFLPRLPSQPLLAGLDWYRQQSALTDSEITP